MNEQAAYPCPSVSTDRMRERIKGLKLGESILFTVPEDVDATDKVAVDRWAATVRSRAKYYSLRLRMCVVTRLRSSVEDNRVLGVRVWRVECGNDSMPD